MALSDNFTEAELAAHGIRSALEGGTLFCGVSQENFAISGVRYQWPKGSKLTWGVDFSRLGNLSGQDVKDVLDSIFKDIETRGNISFSYVQNALQANLIYRVRRLDGARGVLAQMMIPVGNVNPSTQLVCDIDDSEGGAWGIYDGIPPSGQLDIFRTLYHETGHGLGHGHEPANIHDPSLMAPVYSERIRVFQPIDDRELQLRYGAAVNVPQSPATPLPPVGDSLGVEIIIRQGNAVYEAKGPAKRTK